MPNIISYCIFIFAFMLATSATAQLQNGKAPTKEQAAIIYCVGNGATDPLSFSYCVGGALTAAEISQCLQGGSCFGKNNEIRQIIERGRVLGISIGDIQKYGICGGQNSELRKLFGNQCGRVCGTGGGGWIRLINKTNGPVHFSLESDCGEREQFTLGPHLQNEYGNITGDKNYNIDFNSAGGSKLYSLDIGLWYEFYWIGNLLEIKNVTPQYK